MIPWFIVNLIGSVANLFGYNVYCRATGNSWQWGADRVYFLKREPGEPRPSLMPRSDKGRSR